MLREEIVQVRTRARALFKAGDFDHDEIMALWFRQMGSREYTIERANRALDKYALRHGGEKGRFIAGQFMRFLDAEPKDEPRVVLVDREKAQREHDLKSARDAEMIASIKAEREADRRTVLTANPLHVGEIVDDLVAWGAPRPTGQPESWPMPWYLAVADILLDRVRAAPTEAGYFAQVRDERGAWVDDPTKPLRPLPAREWWRHYGAAGLAARGLLAIG